MITARGPRMLLAALAVLLPGRMRRWVHTRLLGYDLHPTASIGRAFVDVDSLVMGEGARIGHLIAIRGCEEVRMGDRAVIHQLVWVNAVRRSTGFFPDIKRRPALVMGDESLITVMHFIDACDLVELAEFAALAGYGSIIQTHAVDVVRIRQSCAPVRIGDHSLVGTRAVLLPGATVPDQSIVSAGAVVGPRLKGHHLFGGVPAKPIRELDPESALFTRQTTHIW